MWDSKCVVSLTWNQKGSRGVHTSWSRSVLGVVGDRAACLAAAAARGDANAGVAPTSGAAPGTVFLGAGPLLAAFPGGCAALAASAAAVPAPARDVGPVLSTAMRTGADAAGAAATDAAADAGDFGAAAPGVLRPWSRGF